MTLGDLKGGGHARASGVLAEPQPLPDVERLAGVQSITAGDLVLGPVLAEGGSHRVHKGTWRGTITAIKTPVINGNAAITQEQRRKIEREVSMGEVKKHRFLVQVYGICHVLCCIVMEYFSNGSVSDMIYSTDPVKQKTASSLIWRLKAAEMIASASDWMHQPPAYLHRDIKPSNVFVCPQHLVKLGDFDRVRSLEEVERDIALGTKEPDRLNLVHHAPEVVDAYMNGRLSGFSCKSDVYSFGLYLRELLDFKTIVDMVTSERDGHRHPEVDEDRCRTIGDWYPCAEDIFDVFRDCIQLDPQARPNFCEIHSRIQKIRQDVEAAIVEEDRTQASRPDPNEPLCTVNFAGSAMVLLIVMTVLLATSLFGGGLTFIHLSLSVVLILVLLCVIYRHLPAYYRNRARSYLRSYRRRMTECTRILWESLVASKVVQPLEPRLEAFPPPPCWSRLRQGFLTDLSLLKKDRKVKTALQFCKQHQEDALSNEDWLALKETVFRSTAVMSTEAWRQFEQESGIHGSVLNASQMIDFDPFAASPGMPVAPLFDLSEENEDRDVGERDIEMCIDEAP